MDYNATIQKVINAKKATESLLERTSAIANKIESMMYSLGVGSLMGGKYTTSETWTSIGTATALRMKTEVGFVDIDCEGVSSNRETCTYWSQYGAHYLMPSRSDIFEFISDIPALFQELEQLAEESESKINVLPDIESVES